MCSICKNISKSSSTFQLQILPPTSAVTKYHSYRAYFTVEEWLGNVAHLNPNEWGWELKDGMLTIILTDRPIAPEQVLFIIYCGCKTVCSKRCKFRKAGFDCTPMCFICTGQTCTNSCPLDGEDMTNEIVKRIGEKSVIYAITQAYNHVITLTHFKVDT